MYYKSVWAVFFFALLTVLSFSPAKTEETQLDAVSAAQGLISHLFSLGDVGDLRSGNIASSISSIPILNLFQEGLMGMSSVAEPVTHLVQEGTAIANFIPAITGLFGGIGNMRRRLQEVKKDENVKNVADNVILEEFFDCSKFQCNDIPAPNHACCRKDTVPQIYYKDSVSQTGFYDYKNFDKTHDNTITFNAPTAFSTADNDYYWPSSTNTYEEIFIANAKVDCSQHNCRKSQIHMCCWGCDRVDCSVEKKSPCCRIKFYLTFDYTGCQHKKFNCATFPQHTCCGVCDAVDCLFHSNHHCCKSCGTINCGISGNKSHECCLVGHLLRGENNKDITLESHKTAMTDAVETEA